MTSADTLSQLEATGGYLFHGSPNGKISVFEPRQAMSGGKKDGEPCVAAAEYAAPAVFMAIFGGRVPAGWNAKSDDGFGFYVGREDFYRVKEEDPKGYVYVFEKSAHEFKKHDAWEWRSHKEVTPHLSVEVVFSDLPRNILLS